MSAAPVVTTTIERDIVDGFTMSASQLLVPTSYRALILGQMDTLRRTSAMRPRHYVAPLQTDTPIAAYKQVEYQISVMPGSYVYGLSFALNTNPEGSSTNPALIHAQLTDLYTETPFFSDYVRGVNFITNGAAATTAGYPVGTFRAPFLFAQPRIICDPGTIQVELYNSDSNPSYAQLTIFVAEPCLPPDQMAALLRQAGYAA